MCHSTTVSFIAPSQAEATLVRRHTGGAKWYSIAGLFEQCFTELNVQ